MKALAKAQVVTGLRGFAAMVFTIAASPVLHDAGVSFQVISLGFGVLYSILAISGEMEERPRDFCCQFPEEPRPGMRYSLPILERKRFKLSIKLIFTN
mgnify:CR=1 FL=1